MPGVIVGHTTSRMTDAVYWHTRDAVPPPGGQARSGRKRLVEDMAKRSLLLVAMLMWSCSHDRPLVSGPVKLDRTETRRYLEVDSRCSCALDVPGRPSQRVRQSSWPAGGCYQQLAPTEELLATRHRHALTGRSAEAPNAGALLFLGPMLRCPNPHGRGGPGAGVPLAAIRGLRGRESESRRRSQPARWSRAPRSAC